MNNYITIAYPQNEACEIQVLYTIEQTGDIQTISCSIEGRGSPYWLQLRKFSMSSQKRQGGYEALFNEVNNSKNMDTALFIDLVYANIMKREHFECA